MSSAKGLCMQNMFMQGENKSKTNKSKTILEKETSVKT